MRWKHRGKPTRLLRNAYKKIDEDKRTDQNIDSFNTFLIIFMN